MGRKFPSEGSTYVGITTSTTVGMVPPYRTTPITLTCSKVRLGVTRFEIFAPLSKDQYPELRHFL